MTRLIASGCLVLLVVAAIRSAHPGAAISPAPPRLGLAVDGSLVAALAPIGPFALFSPDDENPFVPQHGSGSTPPTAGSTATSGGATDGGGGSDHGRDRGRLVLPAGRTYDDALPRCLGEVRHAPSGGQAIIVRQGGVERGLRIGEAIAGWRLLAVEPGSARFLAPEGREVAVGGVR